MNDTDRYSVAWDYGPAERQHIRDADRAADRPDDLSLEVDDGTITAAGTAETIRWLYDYLHHLKRAWRHEGEQWDADAAEEMAESLYEQVNGDLPEQQRNKEAMADGGAVGGGSERTPKWDETPVGGYPSRRSQTNGNGDAQTTEQLTAAQRALAIHEVADELDDIQGELPEAFDAPLERVERSLREAADAAARGFGEEHAIRFLMFDNIGLSPDGGTDDE